MAGTPDFGFREQWHALKQGKPGRRFRDRYAQARKSKGKRGSGQRIVLIVAALVCLAIGVVLAFVPGPAVLFFFIAGGLLASESLVLARFLDDIEVRCRRVLDWAKPRWQRLPAAGRVLILVLAGACSLALMYGSYRFLRD